MQLLDEAPCPCGGERSAGRCCIRRWPVVQRDGSIVEQRTLVIPQADPRPEPPITAKTVEGCYAACLSDCDGPLTGEHFISHRMLQILAGGEGKTLKVTGIDPRNPGVARDVATAKMIAPVLCLRHNNALKPIDTSGNRFFETIADPGKWLVEQAAGTQTVFGVNGHDFERWCLKALCGFLARAKKLVPDLWVRMLFGSGASILPPHGLYVYAAVGDVLHGKDIRIEEVTIAGGGPSVGLVVHLLGYEFVFSMSDTIPVTVDHHDGKWRVYRPSNITLSNAPTGSALGLCLSWQDRVYHAPIEANWTP